MSFDPHSFRFSDEMNTPMYIIMYIMGPGSRADLLEVLF